MRTIKPQRTFKYLLQSRLVHPTEWREYLQTVQQAGSRFARQSRKILDNWR